MKVVAHRGGASAAPENTMAAFRAARVAGVDAVECDVQETADGRLVLLHDMSLDRTTDGSGLVTETAWSVVQGLDAGSWFDPTFAGERVPQLFEVLSLPGLEFEVELKGYGDRFVDRVAAAVRDADALDRVEFTGWNLPLLLLLRSRLPTARLGLFSSRRASWMNDRAFMHHVVGTAMTSGFDVVHVDAAQVTQDIVGRLHDTGFEVHANDADRAADVRRALDAGADRVSANDVAMALAVARSG